MIIGSSPSEFTTHTANQQNNQLIGKLPGWQSRLGAGTSGGGVNLSSLSSQNTPIGQNAPLGGAQGNLPLMIRALLAKQGA
jgi:hypothetical protein